MCLFGIIVHISIKAQKEGKIVSYKQMKTLKINTDMLSQ